MTASAETILGDDPSSIRDQPGLISRAANSPLIVGAIVAWLAITWTVGLRQGFLFLVGIGFGAVLAGVSFGFTSGWRVWIRERDPTGFLAQFLAIGLAMLVSIPLIASHPELTGAIAPLSVSLVIGAFVFGAAMQIADGCGSGTLYKAGLGNGFSLAVFPGFIAGSFFGAAHLDRWLALGSLPPVSLPEQFGVAATLVAQLAVMGALGAWLWRKRRRTDALWKGRGIYVGAVLLAVFAVLESAHRRTTLGHRLWTRAVGREDRHLVRCRSGRECLLGPRSTADAHRIVTADRRDFGDQHRIADRRADRCEFSRACASGHQCYRQTVAGGTHHGLGARLLGAACIRLQCRRLLCRHLDRQPARVGVVGCRVYRLFCRDSAARSVGTQAMKLTRTAIFAMAFWAAAFAFIAIDWSRATPHNRFDEPPPWQLGQEKVDGAGHCASPLTVK